MQKKISLRRICELANKIVVRVSVYDDKTFGVHQGSRDWRLSNILQNDFKLQSASLYVSIQYPILNILVKKTKKYYQKFNIVMIDDMVRRAYPTWRQRVPWPIFDRWKAFEGSPRWWFHFPFFETFSDIAWHSEFQVFYQHTYRYRMQKALADCNLREIEKIVQQYKAKGLKYDINQPIDSKYGFTAMHVAALTNQYAVLEYLMMLGANIQVKDPLGNTPLAHAAMNDCLEATYTLVKSGARINQKDKYGYTILQKAKNRNRVVVPYLEQESKKPQRQVSRPKVQLNPKINKLFKDDWSQFLKNRRIFTGKSLLNPFNNLKGEYRILLSAYNTFGYLNNLKNKKE